MLTSAHRLSRNAVIDPTHSALEPSPAGLEAESRFFWHYEPGDLVLFRLERMRQDFMNAKRCVGWPERFRATLDPSREEYTRHANLFLLLSGMADTKDHSEIVHAQQGSALSNSETPLLQTWKMPVMAENGGIDFFSRPRKRVLGFMPDQRATTCRGGMRYPCFRKRIRPILQSSLWSKSLSCMGFRPGLSPSANPAWPASAEGWMENICMSAISGYPRHPLRGSSTAWIE